jgi:hypothetical protein
MAGDGEQRRMVFDTRGRRRNVVKVVYAVLALLMGGSLFLTVGPFNLGEIAGGGSAGDASEVYDEQIERIEGRLEEDPKDANTLLALTRARLSAGQAKAGTSLESENPQLPPEARDDYQGALEAWTRYLGLVGEDAANPAAAQLVAQTFFTLAERGSYTLAEVEENGLTALRAQRIAAAERPNLNTLSSLALYEYFHGALKAGDKAAKRALASAPTKQEAKNIDKQLDQLRKQGQEYQKSLAQFKAQQEKAGTQGEPFQDPFSLGPGASGSLGE